MSLAGYLTSYLAARREYEMRLLKQSVRWRSYLKQSGQALMLASILLSLTSCVVWKKPSKIDNPNVLWGNQGTKPDESFFMDKDWICGDSTVYRLEKI